MATTTVSDDVFMTFITSKEVGQVRWELVGRWGAPDEAVCPAAWWIPRDSGVSLSPRT